MILGDNPAAPAGASLAGSVTIDEIFHRLAKLKPNAPALADPPNRSVFTDGTKHTLTFAEADRVIAALAARLRQMGLPEDSVVGVQLPNTAENILAILGVMRAGMVPALLPLLWRRADMVAALSRVGCKALLTCSRVGEFNYGQLAIRIAADIFSIRYVAAFGKQLPDGVVSLDDLFLNQESDALRPISTEWHSNSAAHVAAITFDVNDDGLVPVARSHVELLTGGLGVLTESRITKDCPILSTIPPSSYAGLCQTLLPWLLTGGTLLLHHPFDLPTLIRQWRDAGTCGALMLPASVAFRLAEAGAFSEVALGCVVASWRSPEALTTSSSWPYSDIGFVDVSAFGEIGLIAARRSVTGRPAPFRAGVLTAPRESKDGVPLAELSVTSSGTLGLRGSMVPRQNFPPGAERAELPHLTIASDGVVDTGYHCASKNGAKTITVTAPPAGIVNIGGYRLPLRGLQEVAARIDATASLDAVDDPVVGHRFVGSAADISMMKAALGAVGVNPMVISAFQESSEQDLAVPTPSPEINFPGAEVA